VAVRQCDMNGSKKPLMLLTEVVGPMTPAQEAKFHQEQLENAKLRVLDLSRILSSRGSLLTRLLVPPTTNVAPSDVQVPPQAPVGGAALDPATIQYLQGNPEYAQQVLGKRDREPDETATIPEADNQGTDGNQRTVKRARRTNSLSPTEAKSRPVNAVI